MKQNETQEVDEARKPKQKQTGLVLHIYSQHTAGTNSANRRNEDSWGVKSKRVRQQTLNQQVTDESSLLWLFDFTAAPVTQYQHHNKTKQQQLAAVSHVHTVT